ncbi:hypothetical protein D9M70_515890 [compost metagenome]
MPDVHDDQRHPGSDRVLHVVVVDAHAFERAAEQADIDAAEDLPDGADDVPRDQERQRHQHEADRDAETLLRHVEGDDDAERDFDGQNDRREDQVAGERVPEAVGGQHLHVPVGAGPEERVVAEGVLDRIVDDGHQRDDGREGDQHENRQHHEPGLVVPGFFHGQASSPTRQESA